jgi:hypothetical protein
MRHANSPSFDVSAALESREERLLLAELLCLLSISEAAVGGDAKSVAEAAEEAALDAAADGAL